MELTDRNLKFSLVNGLTVYIDSIDEKMQYCLVGVFIILNGQECQHAWDLDGFTIEEDAGYNLNLESPGLSDFIAEVRSQFKRHKKNH